MLSPEGAPRKRVLVGERNSKVLLDLDKALREGNHNVGIVYGGLHLQVSRLHAMPIASLLYNQLMAVKHNVLRIWSVS